MSYSATISFKKIKPEEIFDFFVEIKKKVKENYEKIAEDDFIFSPYAKNKSKYEKDEYNISLFNDCGDWVRRIFSYRYFYNKELGLLGVYGVPNSLRELFDDTLNFQNSCDQDYEFEYWDKIEAFKAIADKWKAMTPDQVYEEYLSDPYRWSYTKEEFMAEGKPEYYARTFCYEEIWDKSLEKTLFDEDSIVYLSLFQYYDSNFTGKFILKVKELYDQFREDCKKKEGGM